MAYIALTLVGCAAVGVVGAYHHSALGVAQVIAHIFVVVGLEICPVAVSVDYAEIGAHAHGFGQAVKKSREIIHAAAGLQSLGHDVTLAVDPRRGVGRQIVGYGVHDGESGVVHAHPSLGEVYGIAAVEEADVADFAIFFDTVYEIIVGRGVAVFPQQRAPRGSGASGGYERCARHCGRRHENGGGGEEKSIEVHFVRCICLIRMPSGRNIL